jgi:hypothetical protein
MFSARFSKKNFFRAKKRQSPKKYEISAKSKKTCQGVLFEHEKHACNVFRVIFEKKFFSLKNDKVPLFGVENPSPTCVR